MIRLTPPGYDRFSQSLQFNVSCFKHTINGDFNLTTVKEAKTLMGDDGFGRVSR